MMASRSPSSLSVASLRVAVSDVSGILETQNSPYRIKADRAGKEVRLSLVRFSGKFQSLCDKCRIIRGEIPLSLQPDELGKSLIREGGTLSPASLYSGYRSAAKWLSYSSGLGQTKRHYEAEAFFQYRIFERLSSPTALGVVSLGPGEGLGEVELLKRLFSCKDGPKSVHYMAVDSSELLLTSHASLIRETFSKQLEEGTLIFAPVHGDLFCLESQISYARERIGSRFLSMDNIAITHFGNCLGNQENQESAFFRRMRDSFPSETRLAFLIGVSLLRWKDAKRKLEPVTDVYYMDAFTLETPRSLVCELNQLVSRDEDGCEIPAASNDEFVIPFHDGNFEGELIPAEPYYTPHGIRGITYRFRYQLKNDLWTADGSMCAKKGTRLVLSSIIKYDLDSLVTALKERDLDVYSPPEDYEVLSMTNGPEEYSYAVLAAVTP